MPVKLGVPAYFAPAYAPDDWAALMSAPAGSVAIVNPASGPAWGMRSAYRDAIAALRRCGTIVVVYVDSAYGARTAAAIVGDVLRYRAAFGFDGVFLDQAPAARRPLIRLSRVVRCVAPGRLRIVNPGHGDVDPAAFSCFDAVVEFEGHRNDHSALTRRDGQGRAARWHLVHGVPDGEQTTVLEHARMLGADLAYATELGMPNPWMRLTRAWPRVVSATATAQPTLGGRLVAVEGPQCA